MRYWTDKWAELDLGYKSDFLPVEVSLETILSPVMGQLADRLDGNGKILDYLHFSAAIHEGRKCPIAAGVIQIKKTSDGKLPKKLFESSSNNDPEISTGEHSSYISFLKATLGELIFIFSSISILKALRDHDDINWGISKIFETIPEGVLRIQEISDELLLRKNNLVELVDETCPGWISQKYLYKSASALSYFASNNANPDKREYSEFMAFFEFSRRLENSSTKQLISSNILCKLVDRDTFLSKLHNIGQSLAQEAESAEEKLEIAELTDSTARRLYPKDSIVPAPRVKLEGLKQADIKPIMIDLVERLEAFQPSHERLRFALTTILGSVPINNHGIVYQAAIEIVESSSWSELLPKSNVLIEVMNRMGWFADALEFAISIKDRIETYKSQKSTPNAINSESEFNCEIGNCFRYKKNFQQALHHYSVAIELKGSDLSSSDSVVLLRNSAIALRGMGRIAEARQILVQLRGSANFQQLIGIENSYVLCLKIEGRYSDAKEHLLKLQPLIKGKALTDSSERLLAFSIAEALISEKKYEKALKIFNAIMRLSPSNVGLRDGLCAKAQKLRIRLLMGKRVSNKHVDDTISQITECIQGNNDATNYHPGNHGLILLGSELLLICQRQNDAEMFMRKFHLLSAENWLIKTRLLHLVASREHAAIEIESELIETLSSIDMHSRVIEPEGDPTSLFGSFEGAINGVVGIADWAFSNGSISESVARVAIDIQSSPVAARRLVHQTNDLSIPASISDGPLEQLFKDPNTAVIQFFSNEDDQICSYVTYVNAGTLKMERVSYSISAAESKNFGRKITFMVDRLVTSTLILDFKMINGLSEALSSFRSKLFSCVQGANKFRIICGPVDAVFISTAFGMEAPFTISPSLSSAVVLDENFQTRGFKAKKLSDFVVWREGDRKEIIEGLMNTSEVLSQMLKNTSTFIRKVGRSADTGALLECLSGADICRITAHGIHNPTTGDFEFLVAHQNSLPASSLRLMTRAKGSKYLLRSNELSNIHDCSSIVLSSACESGAVHTAGGWERLGLERTLFQSGTCCLVAPIWEAPTLATQELTAEIMKQIISNQDKSVQDVVFRVKNDALSQGVSPIAYAGLTVYGSPCYWE